jgi:hypothetical protein
MNLARPKNFMFKAFSLVFNATAFSQRWITDAGQSQLCRTTS